METVFDPRLGKMVDRRTGMPVAGGAQPPAQIGTLDQIFNGTGIPERVNLMSEILNPMVNMRDAGKASQTLFDPDTTGWGRVGAFGNMASNMAGVLAPVMGAKAAGTKSVDAVVEALTNYSAAPRAMGGEFMADEFGGVPLYGGGMSDPTQTGWTFKDVTGRPNLSAAENRRFAGLADDGEFVIPLRSINATQPTVNPDFATGGTSHGELPFAIRKDGQIYLTDGHHRAVTAAEEGAQNIKTRLMDFDNTDKSLPLFDHADAKAAAVDDDALLAELFGTAPQAALMRSLLER